MIKLTDYICNYLANLGVKDVFMISGGGAMHLVDSVGKHPKLKYYCPHHEQAAAIAAEGYARTSGKIGVVVVTSGPGGTNTLTGVIGQWLDSIPCLYLSGQVKKETTIEHYPKLNLRQIGDQEINIIDIVKPVTKYAVMVNDPKTIRYHLEKAIYLATHGRPGPVWLDIPLDVQSAQVDQAKLKGYKPDKNKPTELKIDKFLKLLKTAQRPVVIAGHGIRISGSEKLFFSLIDRLNIPVVSTFNGFDLMPTNHPLFIGRLGTVGDRAGNFAVQNSDLIICLGTRNNIRQISYNWKSFGREAKKVVVDIDPAELVKPTLKADLPINADVKGFIKASLPRSSAIKSATWTKWLHWCQERKVKYPVVLPKYYQQKQLVNPYVFIKTLTEKLDAKAIVVAGNGTACVTLFQAGIVKIGQRMFWNSGCASMGYDLPASIGACIAANKEQVVCLAGDGSLQMNIQELQTVAYHQLPIKIFVLNNSGYISIRQTQESFFNKHYVACDTTCGVSMPDIIKVANAYGLKTKRIEGQDNLAKELKEVLEEKGPFVCEIMLMPDYKFSPKLASQKLPDGRMVSKPLEDLWPFLDRKEFKGNLLIKEWKGE